MGIQFYNGLSNYSYSNRIEIPQVDPSKVSVNPQVEAKEPEKEAPSKVETLSSSQISALDTRSRAASLEDVSLTFNKEDDFDYIGRNAEVKTLDMEKAISDMKKDGILQEYQYFVGSSNNLFESEDGLVIPKN